DQGGRPHRCRFQYRFAFAGQGRAFSRGPVPSVERYPSSFAASARPARRHSAPADPFHGTILPGEYETFAAIHSGGNETADGLRLARKRARTGERGGTRRGP